MKILILLSLFFLAGCLGAETTTTVEIHNRIITPESNETSYSPNINIRNWVDIYGELDDSDEGQFDIVPTLDVAP